MSKALTAINFRIRATYPI